ncbi:MAG: DeoR family transcriptional regulator [Dehalococcoidia bacterium]
MPDPSPSTQAPDSTPSDWRTDPAILDRLARVERLHLRGYTARRIAAYLQCSDRTVRRDLDRLHTRWLERHHDFLLTERRHSLAAFREIERTLWTLIDEQPAGAHNTTLPALIRALIAGGREVRHLLTSIERAPTATPNGDFGTPTVRDMMAQLTDEQLTSVTPEQIALWDLESELASSDPDPDTIAGLRRRIAAAGPATMPSAAGPAAEEA